MDERAVAGDQDKANLLLAGSDLGPHTQKNLGAAGRIHHGPGFVVHGQVVAGRGP